MIAQARGSAVDATDGTAWANTGFTVDGDFGDLDATYGTWTRNVALDTAYIDIGGFDFSSIPAGATIISATVSLRHYISSLTRITEVTITPYVDGVAVDDPHVCTRATSARTDSTTFTLTRAQLVDDTFCIRVFAQRADLVNQSVFYVDFVDIEVEATEGQAGTHYWTGDHYAPVEQLWAKAPGGWVQPASVLQKTDTGWREIMKVSAVS